MKACAAYARSVWPVHQTAPAIPVQAPDPQGTDATDAPDQAPGPVRGPQAPAYPFYNKNLSDWP